MNHLLPDSFISSLKGIQGFDENAFIDAHQKGHGQTSIRINPSKASFNQLSHLPFSHQIPWCENGYHLSQRPSFTLDPLFHAGAYYVQEASSMFLEQVLKAHAPLQESIVVLDCCAAPGGKSTHIQSLISGDSLLVSNEVIKTRVPVLAQNITKWGASNVVVTSNDPRDFQRMGAFFDVIVVDAPCSGSGLFRKDPDAITHWNEELVQMCASRQQRILQDIWPSLKPGGLLVYSTCSYSIEEDEQIIDALITQTGAMSLRVETHQNWGIVETISPMHAAYGYKFFPDKAQGEGFFIAAIRKEQEQQPTTNYHQKNHTSSRSAKQSSLLKPDLFHQWLHNTQHFVFIPLMKDVIAMQEKHFALLQQLQQHCYIKKAGINIGSIAHDELIPSHELAMSQLMAKDWPSIGLDLENALQYLRLQTFEAQDNGKGWKLIKYEGCHLGWVKVLPNRINNYFPRDWRILNK